MGTNFNFNEVILGGRLTADPELKSTPGGLYVTTLILRERDVHYEVRPAMMARKKNIKKKADEREIPKPAKQIKLI